MKKIVLIAVYFGSWPEWFPAFLASCEANPTIQWVIHTDCPVPEPCPRNVMFRSVSRAEYCNWVSGALGIRFTPRSMYNTCSIRPAFADLYASETADFDYVGWCDIDLVFGDLRLFLTNDVLKKEVVTTSSDICTGHFTLLRNTPALRGMYRDIPEWRARMAYPAVPEWPDSLDEAWLSRLCSPVETFREEAKAAGVLPDALDRYRSNNHFVEQWVTPFVPSPWLDGDRLHPEIWYWNAGSLTNWRDGDRQFPYLHFMNFKARRYVDVELYGLAPTWSDRGGMQASDVHAADVIRIDRSGMRGMSLAEAEAERFQLRDFASAGRLSVPDERRSMRSLLDEASRRGVRWLDNGEFFDPAGVLSPQLRQLLVQQASHLSDPFAAEIEVQNSG